MAQEAVIAHEQRVYVVNEATFGTAVLPATTQSCDIVTCDMGPVEVGNTRAIKDKAASRDMQLGFVEGRVAPIPFSIEKSVKSRTTAATAPEESAILQASGLVETIGATVVYSVSSAPTPKSLAVLSVLGPGSSAYEAEHGLGGVVKQLTYSGGDSELMLKAGGAFARKNVLGQSASATVADGTSTAFTLASAADSYLLAPGYAKIDNEVVLITAVAYGTTGFTATRAQAGTTGAAHTAAAIYPYAPTFTPTGVAPISEVNCVVTLDSVATRCTKFSLDITTGMDHRPGETGSKYVQGQKLTRVDVKPSIELLLTKELVALLGKANQRKSVPLTIVCGTGAGGIVTFSMPTCEIEPFAVPAPANDVAMVSPSLRVRGSAGNDLITVTYS